MFKLNFLISAFSVIHFYCANANNYSAFEKDIFSLLTNPNTYNKNLRPDDSVAIQLFLSLQQVVSIDEKSQTMTSSSYLTLYWDDKRISWDKNLYDNEEDINIPISYVWLPDLAVINIKLKTK